MTDRNLPATAPRGVPASRSVLVGEVLYRARPGARSRIRDTWYLRLPGDQVTLDGPLEQVGQIVDLLRARGELLRATPGAPSLRGVMLTLSLRPPVVAGRRSVGAAPRVLPWPWWRKLVVFGGVVPAVVAVVLVVSLVWPLVGVGAAVALAVLGWLLRLVEDGRWFHRNVPHVAIDHVD